MARKIYRRRRVVRKRRVGRKPVRRVGKTGAVNTASIKENFQTSAPDGLVVFQRALQMSNTTFDRTQQVAQAYQEYCIKSVKMVFRPSADTFAPAAGNLIPQLYYVQDKAGAVPTNANLQTLLDMGVKPIRFDARNIVKTYKPVALIGADSDSVGTLSVGLLSKPSPWLATNANAGAPGASWAPSNIEHGGCVFFVSKMAGLTPAINYTVEFEIVFNFRKPLWRATPTSEPNPNMTLNGSGLVPILHE